MNEFMVFQVDTYMGGMFLLSSVMEENQIAFTEFSFLHFLAILLPLVIGVSFEFLPINLAMYLFLSSEDSFFVRFSFGIAPSVGLDL